MTAPQQNSWALVRATQAGDTTAFGDLYSRHAPAIRRYVQRRIFQPELVEDLVSETFTRALNGIHGVNDRGKNLAAWLQTIAANLIRDHLKSARFSRERLSDEIDVRDETEFDHRLVAAEEAAVLMDAIAQLTPDQQRCVHYRFFRDLSVAATAEAMRRSQQAVRVMTFRAIRNLGQHLTELDTDVDAGDQ